MNTTPRVGSVAAFSIDHLRSLGLHAEASASVIADAIDSDTTTVASCLAPYVKAGVLAVRREGRFVFFSVRATGTRVPAEPDDDPPRRKAESQSAPNPAGSSIFATAAAVPHPTTWSAPKKAAKKQPIPAAPKSKWKGKVAPKAIPKKSRRSKPKHRPAVARQLLTVQTPPAISVEPKPHALGVALFNTGDLVLEAPGAAPLRLNRAQTQDLLAYLLKLDQLATPSAQRIAQ